MLLRDCKNEQKWLLAPVSGERQSFRNPPIPECPERRS